LNGDPTWQDTAEAAVAAGAAGAATGSATGAVAGTLGVVLARLGRDELAAWFDVLRGRRAEEFVGDLVRLSDCDLDAVVDAIREHPRLDELVETGLSAAMQTTAETKRVLLARVVAAAVRNPDDARIDEHTVLLRTVVALEPYDLTALVRIATPKAGEGSLGTGPMAGSWLMPEIAIALPTDQRDLADPVVGHLLQERLVFDDGIGRWDYQPAYRATPFARRLLRFLDHAEGSPSATTNGEATIVMTTPTEGFVRCLGPTEVTINHYEVRVDGAAALAGPVPTGLPAVLAPDGSLDLRMGEMPAPFSTLDCVVEWSDARPDSHQYVGRYMVDDKGTVTPVAAV
jgi:hypothetical protein